MTRRSTRTITVLSQASLTTTPWRTRLDITSSPFLRRAVRRRSPSIVLMRAILRRTCRTRAVFSSWPLARWKRRLKILLAAATIELAASARHRFSPGHQSLHRALSSPRRATKRVPTGNLAAARSNASRAVRRDAVELEHDAAGLHPADPEFGRTLAACPADFGRLCATPGRPGRCGSKPARRGGYGG